MQFNCDAITNRIMPDVKKLPLYLLEKPNALMELLNEGIILRHLERVLFSYFQWPCVSVCYRSLVMVEVCVGINAKWVWVANGDYWRCIVELFKPFTLLCVLIWSHKHTHAYRQEEMTNLKTRWRHTRVVEWQFNPVIWLWQLLQSAVISSYF